MSGVLEAELEHCPACGCYTRRRGGHEATQLAIVQVHDAFSVDLSETCADLLVCRTCGHEELVDAEAFECASDRGTGYAGWSPDTGIVLHLHPTWLASSCALCA